MSRGQPYHIAISATGCLASDLSGFFYYNLLDTLVPGTAGGIDMDSDFIEGMAMEYGHPEYLQHQKLL
jgi:hypothetical protein